MSDRISHCLTIQLTLIHTEIKFFRAAWFENIKKKNAYLFETLQLQQLLTSATKLCSSYEKHKRDPELYEKFKRHPELMDWTI